MHRIIESQRVAVCYSTLRVTARCVAGTYILSKMKSVTHWGKGGGLEMKSGVLFEGMGRGRGALNDICYFCIIL